MAFASDYSFLGVLTIESSKLSKSIFFGIPKNSNGFIFERNDSTLESHFSILKF